MVRIPHHGNGHRNSAITSPKEASAPTVPLAISATIYPANTMLLAKNLPRNHKMETRTMAGEATNGRQMIIRTRKTCGRALRLLGVQLSQIMMLGELRQLRERPECVMIIFINNVIEEIGVVTATTTNLGDIRATKNRQPMANGHRLERDRSQRLGGFLKIEARASSSSEALDNAGKETFAPTVTMKQTAKRILRHIPIEGFTIL